MEKIKDREMKKIKECGMIEDGLTRTKTIVEIGMSVLRFHQCQRPLIIIIKNKR